ncbi:50S ribosomal protein L4 [Methanonatronarchaeum sp. AMET-Sl]|uniref:50S ribosomal protein L4 n=1 Tax=Methanonatronarchaeum sp. AMET-Sl TaxID=3037654 RepID=UPI00244DEDF6|nr:50S ribosomal protein L4 [Methanonatronarchaeum sp. AMET-Sl]WGI17234.1 50S ribosomal protein L4 [Methanonatronarchaeum sp. AMET-Sl]
MTKLYSTYAEEKGEKELPSVFKTQYRPDLINKAFLSIQANKKQPYGSNELSGKRTTAESWGAGRGAAMVPRIKTGRRAAFVPQAVGGRRTHPPKKQKDYSKDINKKEKQLALKSAIAATADQELVKSRGHKVEKSPVIVEDDFQEIKKTKRVSEFLKLSGLWEDVKRAKNGTKKKNGEKKVPKSLLIVYDEDKGIYRGARNLPGVDIIDVNNLNIELLAPGGDAGRPTIWTESALEKSEEVF